MVQYMISQSNVPWKVFIHKEDEFLIELDKDEILKRISDNKRRTFEAYRRTYIDGHSRYATSYIKQMVWEEKRYRERLHEEWKSHLDEETSISDKKTDDLRAIRDKLKPALDKMKKKGYYQ